MNIQTKEPKESKVSVTDVYSDPEMKNINVTLTQAPPEKENPYYIERWIGSKVDDVKKGNPKVYMSTIKSMMIFISDQSYLQFAHHRFITDDKDLQQVIEGNGLFGRDIFEGEFPSYVKKQIERDRKYITKDEAEFE